MTTKILMGLVFLGVWTTLLCGCDTQSQTQLPQAVQPPIAPLAPPQALPQPVMPVAAPPVVVPPATPLIPIAKEPVATSKGKVGSGIDKPLPGVGTSGDELVGNYTCNIKTSDLPLGISPPASGCRIFKAGDDKLRIGPSGGGIGISGNVTSTKASGFVIVGTYNLPGNKFNIKARMARKGASKFSGNGRGVLNGNKSKAIKYTLTMTKK